MLMQPSPTADTSIPLDPNILVRMAGPYRRARRRAARPPEAG